MNYTSLCYLERGDSYLMLHRVKKQNDINKDKWLGVGGHFEHGESPEDCMKREVYEETGFTVTKWRYRGIITFVNTFCECEYMHLFTCSEWKGNQKSCDEGELEWIKKSELAKLPMWEGDRIFLDLISNESTPFFSLKLIYNGEKLQRYEIDGRAPIPVNVSVVPYKREYRDEMILTVLMAKEALGRTPRINDDLLDIKSAYIDKGDMFWVALADGRVVGCVGYNSIEGSDEAILHRLYIRPELKRCGIGTKLLKTAEEYIFSQNKSAINIHLGTPKELWFESYAFYAKHGYTISDDKAYKRIKQ